MDRLGRSWKPGLLLIGGLCAVVGLAGGGWLAAERPGNQQEGRGGHSCPGGYAGHYRPAPVRRRPEPILPPASARLQAGVPRRRPTAAAPPWPR